MAELAGEVLKLSDLREVAKKELGTILDHIHYGGDHSKVIVLDPSLINAMKYSGITKDLFTKEKNVHAIFPLQEKAEMLPNVRNVVFFVRPSVELMTQVAAHVTAVTSRFSRIAIWIYFLPKKTLICQHILDNEYRLPEKKEIALIEYGEFDMDLIPIDDDVLSMEMGNCFKELYLDGDMAVLHTIAKAIMKLQTGIFGPIPTIRGKGKQAAKVVHILKRLTAEVGTDFVAENTPELEALYIVDRGSDLLTPMVTQLTYEGLIEEIYGIETGHFYPPFEMVRQTGEGEEEKVGDKRRVPLNNSDKMFAEIRDKNFSQVGGLLHQKAMWVRDSLARRKEVTALKDLREFMRGLPEMQEFQRLVGIHTNICSAVGKKTNSAEFRKQIAIEQNIIQQIDEKEVIDFIEDLINKGESLKRVLRLMSMMSVVNNGLKPKVYDTLKESLMLSYGIPQIITAMHCLDHAGLIVRQDARSTWAAARKAGRVWVDNLNEKHPDDISYAYSGYAPPLMRVVEAMADPTGQKWKSDYLEHHVPGERAEITTDAEVAGSTRVIGVFVIGGVTHAEISMIRFIAGQSDPEHMRQVVICTTNITSGSKALESILPFNAS